jgi:hypothetical protein
MWTFFCNVDNSFATVTQDWVINFNIGAKYLTFHMVNHSYWAHIFNVTIGVNKLVCRDVFLAFIAQMKTQCSVVVNMFITKLDRRFMESEFMNVFNIAYPQFWNQLNVDFSFLLHTILIKKHYY